MTVTVYDIAERAKVSHTTVSRVLNKRKSSFISENTRERILAIAREMGYRPNRAARSLVTGQTGQIAYFAPTINARFFQEMGYQIHQILRHHGYEMLVGEIRQKVSENITVLSRLGVDGIILFGGCLGDLQEPLEANLPFLPPLVNIGTQCRGNLDFVSVDLYSPSRLAVQNLLDHGRTRVAFMVGWVTEHQDGRYRAYHDVLREVGGKPEIIHSADWTRPAARLAAKQHIQDHGCPEAIFCNNDELAIGVCRGLLDLGIRIPQDVELVGCDGIEDLEYFDSSISTIRWPAQDVCLQAWEFLDRRMKDKTQPQQTAVLEAHFVDRTQPEEHSG